MIKEYFDQHPAALANDLIEHYGLSDETAAVVRSVLVQSRHHHLGTALLAIAGALFFGLGFGRVLQLVHVRAWRLELPVRAGDQARYATVLFGVYGLLLLLLVELAVVDGDIGWLRLVLTPAWIALLALFFVWAPRLLTHDLLSRRDLVPGAVLTALGLVALMLISGRVMEPWIDLYAKDYGGFGSDGDLLLDRVQLLRHRRVRRCVAGARRTARCQGRRRPGRLKLRSGDSSRGRPGTPFAVVDPPHGDVRGTA